MAIVAGCWVDIFELSHFGGRHRRLFGPSDFRSLRSRDQRRGIPIESIVVGPNAHVRLYLCVGDQAGHLFTPGQTAVQLSALGIDDAIDSLRISDRAEDSIYLLEAGSPFEAQPKTHG